MATGKTRAHARLDALHSRLSGIAGFHAVDLQREAALLRAEIAGLQLAIDELYRPEAERLPCPAHPPGYDLDCDAINRATELAGTNDAWRDTLSIGLEHYGYWIVETKERE